MDAKSTKSHFKNIYANMQIKQAAESDNNWGNDNTSTFDIVKTEKDESNENCLLVETKSHCFRLYHIQSDDTLLLLSVTELDDDESKDDDNILMKATQVVQVAKNSIVEHPFSIGLPLTIAGAGVSATLVGFGAAGIVGGSIAAAIQSSIGNVAAGGVFATMQGLGASGAFSAMTTGGLVTAGASGAAVAVASSGDDESKEADKTNDGDHVETSNSKAHCMEDLQKLVGSKVMIVEDKVLVVCHES